MGYAPYDLLDPSTAGVSRYTRGSMRPNARRFPIQDNGLPRSLTAIRSVSAVAFSAADPVRLYLSSEGRIGKPGGMVQSGRLAISPEGERRAVGLDLQALDGYADLLFNVLGELYKF